MGKHHITAKEMNQHAPALSSCNSQPAKTRASVTTTPDKRVVRSGTSAAAAAAAAADDDDDDDDAFA